TGSGVDAGPAVLLATRGEGAPRPSRRKCHGIAHSLLRAGYPGDDYVHGLLPPALLLCAGRQLLHGLLHAPVLIDNAGDVCPNPGEPVPALTSFRGTGPGYEPQTRRRRLAGGFFRGRHSN